MRQPLALRLPIGTPPACEVCGAVGEIIRHPQGRSTVGPHTLDMRSHSGSPWCVKDSLQTIRTLCAHCRACLTGRLRCDVMGPGGGVGGATELDERGAQRHRGAAGLDQQLRRYEELHASAGPRRCSLRPYGCVWRESVIHTADPLRILIQSVWGRTVGRPGGLRMISPSAPAAPYAHRIVHRIVYRKCRSAPVLGAACAPIPPYEQSG